MFAISPLQQAMWLVGEQPYYLLESVIHVVNPLNHPQCKATLTLNQLVSKQRWGNAHLTCSMASYVASRVGLAVCNEMESISLRYVSTVTKLKVHCLLISRAVVSMVKMFSR